MIERNDSSGAIRLSYLGVAFLPVLTLVICAFDTAPPRHWFVSDCNSAWLSLHYDRGIITVLYSASTGAPPLRAWRPADLAYSSGRVESYLRWLRYLSAVRQGYELATPTEKAYHDRRVSDYPNDQGTLSDRLPSVLEYMRTQLAGDLLTARLRDQSFYAAFAMRPAIEATIRVPVWFLLATPLCGQTLLIVVRSLRRRRRCSLGLCVQCGYSLTGNTSGVCTECGTPTGRPIKY